MTERIYQPTLQTPPIRRAEPHADDPSSFLKAHYQHLWETRMHDLPFVNLNLQVDVIGFMRHEGDWIGVVITPWFLNLLLISGGGKLWGDIPADARRYLALPCGALQFIADDDPDIGPYQYCPLIAPVSNLPDMSAARQAAVDAMKSVFTPLAEPPAVDEVSRKKAPVTRRGFFRRLAGKRP